MNLRPLLPFALLLVLGRVALAHDPDLSAIRWIRGARSDVLTVTVHRSRLERAEGRTLNPTAIDAAIRRRLALAGYSTIAMPRTADLSIDSAADIVRWEATFQGLRSSLKATAPLLPEDPRSATVFQEIRGGHVVDEALLAADGPVPSRYQNTGLVRWIREGLNHIAGGWDHLLYVLGLVLVARRLRPALLAVTGFTLAHSATLAASALGWIRFPTPWIEALVAVSIVAIAAESIYGGSTPNPRTRWHTFGFGLVHGCAFAGGLQAVLGASDSVLPAIVGFNIGVELGQIGVVVASAPLLGWLERRAPKGLTVLRTALATGIGLAGLWWLGARIPLLLQRVG